ncbi:SWI/SNF and RSC complexes subunit-like protein [Emericellopsis cladophorae]|uniref:SWI/SNF and RSC complexes subunit-like protein n=1 Tax=Emericellopsis cladophorae TaxID=2686198 RepID=A0A9Q0BDH5_9HYPO|nr:SWI/SNF and RSC complexes subunit-like protein [Emericellopsis cladophorae]KAI6780184.1 SWI/SNF and RSC complexes subunit-like protein [Emericellopsis cladophorae]
MSQPDPSFSVPQELIGHVHLVSSHRFPRVANVNVNEVANWLMNAPSIARDKASFCWQFLERPADGTIIMTWQPLQRLNTAFASDGYIWAPPETLYKHDLGNGLILEIYYLKSGFVPQQEQYATHARRRFRLVPAQGHPNAPQPDPNLFIIHWGPAEPADQMPATMIPVDQRIHATMQARQHLLRQGQIRRKDFMLSDRANWPTLPELTGRPMEQQMAPRGVPQHMAYPPQGMAGPPAKRARHASNPSQQVPTPGMPGQNVPGPMDMVAFDDDEDTSRGDMFDHMTPREISYARYQQNHEWMEEILSSPYRMYQITPSDLGLGLKGSLASLTEGIFAAQGAEAYQQTVEADKAYVGRLDPEKATEFRKRVDEHIAKEKDEMEEMKKAHEADLAAMKDKSIMSVREKELRHLQDAGSELWMPHENGEIKNEELKKTVDEIMKEIEGSTGRKIESQPTVKCVQKGGYQAPVAPEPAPVAAAPSNQMSRQASNAGSQTSALMMGESDIDMGNTAAGLLDQMGTGMSAHSTPGNFPTPQAHLVGAQSSVATPQNVNVGSPTVPQQQQQQQQSMQPQPQQQSGDVNMGGTEAQKMTPGQSTTGGDWVVVPKDNTAATNAPSASNGGTEPTPPVPRVPSAAGTPGLNDTGFDHSDFGSLGDLDSAGDALASFDTGDLDGGAGSMGDGLDLSMDMEDSAFGDAFHGVGGSAGQTPSGHDGM